MMTDGRGGMKRSMKEVDQNQRRWMKKKKLANVPSLPKNALTQLNEIKPGLTFQLEGQSGPVHAPTFTMTVEMNGRVYKGRGTSKKKAKLLAARSALSSFVQFINASDAHKALGRQITSGDFTKDPDNTSKSQFSNFDAGSGANREPGSGDTLENTTNRSHPNQPVGKNPIMILNEIRPGIKYDCVSESGESHFKNFVMSVDVDNITFHGEGRNKKLAKSRAAQSALEKICNLQFRAAPGKIITVLS